MAVNQLPVANLARAVATELWGRRVPAEVGEGGIEKNLQIWVATQIEKWTDKYEGRFKVKCEPLTGEVVPVRAFATSFWPDISIESTEADLLVAIEVKYLRPRVVPTLVTRALGQALIYRQIYQQSLVVLVPIQGMVLEPPPPPFFENVAEHQIEVTFLRADRDKVDAL